MPRNPRPVAKPPLLVFSEQAAAGAFGGGDMTGTSPIVVSGNNISILDSAFGPGPIWFGAGLEGDVTLGGDTTLSANNYCRQYENLNLNGYILSQDSSDKIIIIFVRDTLTLANGAIVNGATPVAGKGGGNATTGGGAGGASAGSRGSTFVFARNIVGTGLISAVGRPGTPGVDGTGGGNSGGGAGVAGSGDYIAYGTSYNAQFTIATAGAGGLPGDYNPDSALGGTGGVGYVAGATGNLSNGYRDYLSILHSSGPENATGAVSGKYFAPAVGAGGGGGGSGGSGANHNGGGGGGGGGAPGFAKVAESGGAGGNGGGINIIGPGKGSGGGGGGGGGAGSVCAVVARSAESGLTVTARGGAGGDGGSASNVAGGGGGGGGGSGGIAIYVGPSGPTITASGGSGGAGGVSSGTTGSPGVAGGTGLEIAVYTD